MEWSVYTYGIITGAAISYAVYILRDKVRKSCNTCEYRLMRDRVSQGYKPIVKKEASEGYDKRADLIPMHEPMRNRAQRVKKKKYK